MKDYFGTTQKITQKTTQERILDLLVGNPNLSRKDLSIILKISDDGIKYHINKLRKAEKIKRVDGKKRWLLGITLI